MKKTAIKEALPHLLALLIFAVLSIGYFFPQIQGKKVQQSDIINFLYMSHEATSYEKETGEVTHWTNSMFGGMPTYQIASPVRSNMLRYVEQATGLFFKRPIGYFITLMLGMYILLLTLKVRPLLAVVGAIAFAFTTNNLVLFEAGHTSKVRSIAMFAPILAGVILTYRGKYLWGGILFAVAMGIEVFANHPQMTYYFGLIMIVWVIAQFITDLKAGKIAHFAKASGILTLGVVLAMGASYSKIASTLEYQADTMRGDPILESAGEATSSSNTKGLEWNYAMNWSNGVSDLWAGLIPGFVGGSSAEHVGKDSEFSKLLRRAGQSADRAPLYWGGLPSTSGPNYYGAGFIFLFVLGLFLYKGSLKWWIVFGVIFTMLLSMGKNFESFQRIFFDYFPLYNKFRAHASALSVTSLLIPLLGILGVSQILEGKVSMEKANKAVLYSLGIVGGLCLLFGVGGSAFFDFSGAIDARYLENPQSGRQIVSALESDRQGMMQSDAFRSLGIILSFAALLWFFTKNKVNQTILLAGLGLITIFDLFMVGKRYLNGDSFQSKSQYQANFRPRPADEQILKDPDPNYRVMDLSINTFNDARASYFHKTVGGYHAAKLQRYQDIIDTHISRGNQGVMNMLNTKWIITREGQAQKNQAALGNGWFVKNIQQVPNANAEIEALTDLSPWETAIVHSEFADYVSGLGAASGSIQLTEYKPNKLTYTSESSAEGLAVFSEIWYGPNKGWQAYIDGQPVDHIRANYILRALKVPSGKHEIVFEFKPSSFASGEMISWISSILIVLAMFGAIFLSLKNWYAELPNEVVVEKEEKKPVKKTKRKK